MPARLTTRLFLVGLLPVPVMALILMMGAALRGIGQVVGSLVLGLVLRHAVFLLLLIGFVALSGRLDAPTAMGLHVLAAVIALTYGLANWMLHRPVAQTPQPQIHIDRQDMLRATGIMGVIAGAQTLNANLDVIMIGAFRDAQTAGIYKLSATMALLTVILWNVALHALVRKRLAINSTPFAFGL